ncbi:response regulator [Leptospira congkakensis]|uniref:histidine kinase n=1 Tax=Leptospira congkakensis TaxID=2484932 RepID=A0A4Z1AFN7_9LEPT|nr:ATP-binding protein [Leptospira congkakensis]TGL87209.1 response regulator [Leptospira congkakensis]TGL96776.1 response regulator [Leptospira congkakensis]TGL97626.1 response regulator [Leptospira congkakensis]
MDIQKKLNVLIVEDSLASYKAIVSVLQNFGFSIFSERAEWKAEFEQRISDETWDIVITDFYLPDFDGRYVITRVKEINPDLPVILITEFLPEEAASEFLNLGAAEFLPKSSIIKLPFVVNRELEAYRLKLSQKKAWDMLVHGEELLTRSQKISHLGHFEVIFPEKNTLWSLELYRILGFDFGEIPLMEKVWALLDEPEHDHIKVVWEELLKDNHSKEMIVTLNTKLGRKKVNLWLEAERFEDSRFRIFGTIHDISDLTELEHSIQVNEQLFKGIFNNSSQAIFLLDLQGHVIRMNRNAVLSFERDETDIQGLELIRSVFSNSDEESIKKLTYGMKLALKNQSFEVFVSYSLSDGREKYFDCDFYPLTDPSGKIIYIVLEAKDITEKIVLERAYAQSQKLEALGTFAGGIAHDFNNLLTPMLAYVSYLNSEWSKDDSNEAIKKSLPAIEGISKSLDRARNLIQQILTYSKIDNSVSKQLDLREQLQQVLQEVKVVSTNQIDLVTDLGSEHAYINADPIQIFQILSNLYENAVFALQEITNPKITISLSKVSYEKSELLHVGFMKNTEYWKLRFADNGSGIAPEIIEKIFDPFFTTKGGKGTGLGLPIIYGIMVKMGGTILVNSSLGAGTEFDLYFPAWRTML